MTNTAPTFKELRIRFPRASDIRFNDHYIIVEKTHFPKKQKILYIYNVKENRELSQSEIDEMVNAHVNF